MTVDLQIPWNYYSRFTDPIKLWQSIYRSHESMTVDLQIPWNYDSRFTDPMHDNCKLNHTRERKDILEKKYSEKGGKCEGQFSKKQFEIVKCGNR
jgi:hypothetical protein